MYLKNQFNEPAKKINFASKRQIAIQLISIK